MQDIYKEFPENSNIRSFVKDIEGDNMSSSSDSFYSYKAEKEV